LKDNKKEKKEDKKSEEKKPEEAEEGQIEEKKNDMFEYDDEDDQGPAQVDTDGLNAEDRNKIEDILYDEV
jgi:hypothetical protein